jgi:hypothetical protein
MTEIRWPITEIPTAEAGRTAPLSTAKTLAPPARMSLTRPVGTGQRWRQKLYRLAYGQHGERRSRPSAADLTFVVDRPSGFL